VGGAQLLHGRPPGDPLSPRLPVLALLLAAWAGFGLLPGPWYLPCAILALLLLAARERAAGILTSVPFAVLQLGTLAGLAVLHAVTGLPAIPLGRPLPALLALLGASMVVTAWKRGAYDRARAGFLLVHGAPVLLLPALLGPPWAAAGGLAALALGSAWMFWLKPLLKAPKDKTPPPRWQRWVLQGTRILFLTAGAPLLLAAFRGANPPRGPLAAWLLLAVALHAHHVKPWKGQAAQLAGLAAWALGLGACLLWH